MNTKTKTGTGYGLEDAVCEQRINTPHEAIVHSMDNLERSLENLTTLFERIRGEASCEQVENEGKRAHPSLEGVLQTTPARIQNSTDRVHELIRGIEASLFEV